MARKFDLDALMDHAPAVRMSEFGAEVLQLRLRRAPSPLSVRPNGERKGGDACISAILFSAGA